jgi:hypothetical protein
VPDTIVIVPPFLAAAGAVLDELDDELELELPQAATTTAAASAVTAKAAARSCLLIDPSS